MCDPLSMAAVGLNALGNAQKVSAQNSAIRRQIDTIRGENSRQKDIYDRRREQTRTARERQQELQLQADSRLKEALDFLSFNSHSARMGARAESNAARDMADITKIDPSLLDFTDPGSPSMGRRYAAKKLNEAFTNGQEQARLAAVLGAMNDIASESGQAINTSAQDIGQISNFAGGERNKAKTLDALDDYVSQASQNASLIEQNAAAVPHGGKMMLGDILNFGGNLAMLGSLRGVGMAKNPFGGVLPVPVPKPTAPLRPGV